MQKDELQVESPVEVLEEGPERETVAQTHNLRDKCLVAFRNYANEVNKTCELLNGLTTDIPLDQLLALLAQAQTESRAQEVYLLLREQLFDVVVAKQIRSPDNGPKPS